jgi:fumarate reductase subunit D
LVAGVEMKAETHKVARLHAILWGIFSLGGMIAAFLLPVMIYLTAIAYPFGLWPFNPRLAIPLASCMLSDCSGTKNPSFLVTGHLLGALFVFITIAGSLYHGIFRFQSVLTEVGLLKYRRALEAVGYFIIFVGIIVLAYYLGSWYLNGTIR